MSENTFPRSWQKSFRVGGFGRIRTTEFDGGHGKRCIGGFCRGCRVPLQSAAVQSAERAATDVLSFFQIVTNSAAMTRLFHGASAVGATMDPAEGAGCRCRVTRCREPCVQQWILQKVQGASAECCPCRVPCVQRKIRALAFTNRRSRTSRIRPPFRIPQA